MHPEELCRMIQCNDDNAAEDTEYEHEMTSHEYLQKYEGTKQFSLRMYFNLVNEERRQRLENRRR